MRESIKEIGAGQLTARAHRGCISAEHILDSLYNQWRVLLEQLQGGLRDVSAIVESLEQLLIELIARFMMDAARSQEAIAHVAARTMLDRVRGDIADEAWNAGFRLSCQDPRHNLIHSTEVDIMRQTLVRALAFTEDGRNTVLNSYLHFMRALLESYETTDV